MIVPRYWAEGRVQRREKGKQVTIRRFGWSHVSESAAQAHADTRAAEALQRVLSGEKLERREPKVAYNGAEGVPIREEIVAEHGATILTRNSYGAVCLNTPDGLFADIDFEQPSTMPLGCSIWVLLLLPAALYAWNEGSLRTFFSLAAAAIIVGQIVAWSWKRLFLVFNGGARKLATRRIRRFITAHPDWRVRIYRTPAGYRVLAMHRTFAPDDTEVTGFFNALGTDRLYMKMCQRQRCFRARVSPKPWRMGIDTHLKPRPGLWPVRPEALPARRAWLNAYDEKAAAFASCHFETELGDGGIDPKTQAVQRLHDELCRCENGLPMA